MTYSLHAPTTDVRFLRERREEVRAELNRIEASLARLMPAPVCRLCKANRCHGTLDWTVCGPCWNEHDGKPPVAP